MNGLQRASLCRGESPRRAVAGGEAAPRSVLPEALWAWIFSRDARVIVLCFDHTLARFLTPRRKPRLAPTLTRALKLISGEPKNGVVIHSESGLDRFRGLLSGLRTHLIGENGWEESMVDGRKSVHQLAGRTQRRLESAARAAEACGWRPQLVQRRCSLMLRTTGLPTERAELLRRLAEQLWSPTFETDGLRLHSTPDGPELRAAERSTEAAVDEAADRLWPSATVVHLGLTCRIPEGSAHADWRSPSFQVRRSGALDVALASPRDVLRLLVEWPDRQDTVGPSVRCEQDQRGATGGLPRPGGE